MSKLSRRTILRSGAAALMLPILESDAVASVASQPEIPKRLVFVAMGYGVDDAKWFPNKNQVGTKYEMPESLKPLEELRSDFSVIQNLSNRRLAGPHAGTTNFLTCASNMKSESGAFRNSVSCDQIAAEAIGKNTRFKSLAIGPSSRSPDGHGGPKGYASWSPEGQPVGLRRSVADVYKALFGANNQSVDEARAMLARKQSSLDALTSNAKKLTSRISAADRQRVDEYFTTIRSIETQIQKAQSWVNKPFPKPSYPLPQKVSGRKQVQLMFDLMHVALMTDSTRVITYMLPAREILKAISSRINPHNLSHFGVNGSKHATQIKRDYACSELVAEFLKKLKDTKEYDGSSLLDHSLVAYGSALRRGHNAKNGPMLLAGHGGGGLKQGQNLVYKANKTPLSNLWLSMIRHVGVNQKRFANSDNILSEIGFK